MAELVYLVAVSLDGYIAGPDDQHNDFLFDGDHLPYLADTFPDAFPTHFAEPLGLDQDRGPFGSVVMGATTYAMGLPDAPSPYQHLNQFVFTHRPHSPVTDITFTDANPISLVQELKKGAGDIWLCGGANLATALIDEIDRLVLKQHPLLFGSGIPLFEPGAYSPSTFELTNCQRFNSSVTVADYRRVQN